MDTVPAGATGNGNLFLTKTISGATLAPNLSLTLGVDKTTAIPGDTLTYTATITNTGSTVTLTGDFTARNTLATAMQVASYFDDFATSANEACTPAITHGHNTAGWTALAGTAGTQAGYTPVDPASLATGMTLALTPVPAEGVTYPTSGDLILGTQLQPGATADWHYTATMPLTPTQVSVLLDKTNVTEMRNTFHAEVTPRVQSGNGQPDTVNNIFCQLLGLSGSVTGVTVTITPPEGAAAVAFTKSTTPGLAAIAPGQSVTVITSHVVNTVAAKTNTETDTAYLARLASIDGSKLQATAAATGTGASGTFSAPAPSPVVTTEQLPIVTITKSGPATADAGTTETNPLSLQNTGEAAGSGLTITDSVPGGTTGTVSSIPATLVPAGTGSATASFSVPTSQPNGNLTDTAAVVWQDANGNSYGPVSSSFTTQVQSSLAGATLTLLPASAGPDVTGTSQTLTATLLDRNHTPIANQTVTFTVTGANPTSGSVATDANGLATFSYQGTNNGSDQVQATLSSGGATLQSNTATVSWVTPITTVSTTSVTGRFYYGGCGSFCANVANPPVFTQMFPTIDFNPPGGTVPNNITSVGVDTRPFTDITTNAVGDFTGAVVAQGNGHQAGVGDLFGFDAIFTGTYVVAAAGDITFNFYSDDGFIFGVSSGATRVGGPQVNAPSTTPLQGYPVMGAFNVPTSPVANQITVHFPAAGTYPYEVDYSECCGGQVALTMATSATGHGVAPAGNLAITPVNVPTQSVGQPVKLTVAAMDASGFAIVSLPLTMTISGPNEQQVSGTTDATGTAVLSYTGATGGTDLVIVGGSVSGMPAVSNTVAVTWAFGGGSSATQPPPTILNPSPADGTVVTRPTPITAQFTPPTGQTIVSWSVSYQDLAPLAPIALASGSCSPTSPQPCPPATLATFDPTLLPNDTYAIDISATASGGGTQTLTTTVPVFGNLKLGRYVTTYQDLSVPVNGFPMEVRRIYDSIDKRSGDFGVGWHVSLVNFRVTANRQLGDGGWTEYPTQCTIGLCFWAFKTSTPHYVTVTYPDQHQEVFDFTPQGGAAFLYFEGTAAFTARSGTGTTSTLAALDRGLSYGFDGNLYGTGGFYNPTRFKLTTHDGQVLILDTTLGLVSETDRNGNSLTVDSTGIHASSGQSITYSRDAQGRITQIVGPSGQTLAYTYSSAGDLASSTDANGNTTTYSYDNNHNLLQATGPGGHPLQTLQYDGSGRLTAITDADGNTTQIANNVFGQQQTIGDPNGQLTTLDTFDELGDLLREDKVFNGQTLTTSFTYDAVGRPLSRTNPLGLTTSATYDTAGDLLTVVNPAGGVTNFAYNSFGEPTSETDTQGAVTTSDYDSQGNLVRVTQPDGSTYSFQHDAAGHTTVATDPMANTTSYGYDSAGRLVSETNALGQKTTWGVDASGNVTSVTDPTGSTTNFSHDGMGNLIRLGDALGHATTFSYDAFEHVLSTTDALGHITSYQYDPAELLQQVTNPDGQVVTYSYDVDGRILSETLPGNDVTSYVHDPLGRLARATNSDSVASFTYDADGRIVSTSTGGTATSNQPQVTVTYTYDSRGNRTSVEDPAGTVAYAYDSVSRPTQITDPSGGRFGLTYDPLSRLISLNRPNGVSDAFTYDAAGNLLSRVSSLNGATLQAYSYTLNAATLRTSLTDITGTSNYTYSAVSRLTGASHPAGGSPAETYAYDAVGNRISSAFQPAGSLTYDAANELLAGPTSIYTYDADGQRISKTDRVTGAATRYIWNARHQLTGISFPDGTSTTFRYDPIGRRIELNHAGSITRYVYNGANTSLEYDGSNNLAASYVSGPGIDSRLEMTRGTNRYYFLRDGLGSTTALTDATGAVAQTYSYDSYGRQIASGNVANLFTYTGREYDTSTSLYYYRARYYDPATGTFLSEDPLHGVNPYIYANDDPTNMVDPLGTQAVSEFALALVSTSYRVSALLPYAKLNACLWGVLLIALQEMSTPQLQWEQSSYETQQDVNLLIRLYGLIRQIQDPTTLLSWTSTTTTGLSTGYSLRQYVKDTNDIAHGAPCDQDKALENLCSLRLQPPPPGS